MAYANTIQDLTGYMYNELEYKIISPVTGSFIGVIQEVLKKCDIAITAGGNEYDLQMQQAVMEFQSKAGIQATGILNNATWRTMLAYATKYQDIIQDIAASEETTVDTGQVSPHYGSFFDSDNIKNHRKNGKDIKIVFGNNSITKTLKNVFMRSVHVEVDTSGNPISEVYEFIAQDVKESDEPMDVNKYTSPESFVDTKIQYSFGRIMK